MNHKNTAILGAAFLMATSAIGPGFLTTTAVFTERLAASFGFVILISIIIDILVQSNIWQIIAIGGKPAQVLVNEYRSGYGNLLALLIFSGGFVFNMGNIAGCGLGLEVLFGLSPLWSSLISVLLAILLFMQKNMGKAMDIFSRVLGLLMISFMAYVAFSSKPPVAEAALKTIWPDEVDVLAIITIVGGTVGGYISFSGAHRLLLGGISGRQNLGAVRQGANTAIGIASLMRILLFLAAFGVVSTGVTLDPSNPAATVFESPAGVWGLKIFGLVIWAASITSVVGASYTSVTFVQHLHPSISKHLARYIIGFMVCSALVFLLFGKPVKILILAGALNGFILAIALLLLLFSVKKLMQTDQYPRLWWYGGLFTALVLLVFGLVLAVKTI